MKKGDRIEIVSIGEDDSWYELSKELIGVTGTLLDADLTDEDYRLVIPTKEDKGYVHCRIMLDKPIDDGEFKGLKDIYFFNVKIKAEKE